MIMGIKILTAVQDRVAETYGDNFRSMSHSNNTNVVVCSTNDASTASPMPIHLSLVFTTADS